MNQTRRLLLVYPTRSPAFMIAQRGFINWAARRNFSQSATNLLELPSLLHLRNRVDLFEHQHRFVALTPFANSQLFSTNKDRPPTISAKLAQSLKQDDIEQSVQARSAKASTHLSKPQPHKEDPPVYDSIKSDMNAVSDTLALTMVPREPYFVGLAGTLPYFTMSLTTVYLSWSLKAHGGSYVPVIHQDIANYWLQLLEPVQLGYGALIISFLGAIHWGLEFSEIESSPDRTKFRYSIGVAAPALAWPTLLLPVQFALIGQLLTFTFVYFVDSRAVSRGWAPAWYGTYRFVLTSIVGSAIMICLLFRAKVESAGGTDIPGRIKEGKHQRGKGEEPYDARWAEIETKDVQRLSKEEENHKGKDDGPLKSTRLVGVEDANDISVKNETSIEEHKPATK